MGTAEDPPRKMTDRLEFLGRLAAGLAHEIKNPLSTMTVTLQLLKEDWEDSEERRDRRSLRKIDLLLKEVDRLEGILEDFLRFARDSEKNLTEVDVAEVVQEVLDFIGPEAEKHAIRILNVAEPELPACRLDRNLFKQALLNVLVNAQQAMEDRGGELLIRTKRGGDSLFVEIVDTGPGMSPAVRERIFDVYYSTKRGGTGLGLPTARRFVEEHGGEIRIESEEGRGTSVTLCLPLPEGESTPAEEGTGE